MKRDVTWIYQNPLKNDDSRCFDTPHKGKAFILGDAIYWGVDKRRNLFLTTEKKKDRVFVGYFGRMAPENDTVAMNIANWYELYPVVYEKTFKIPCNNHIPEPNYL